MDRFDISIIGGGVIGLAVARALSLDPRFSNKSIVLLEQEAQFGQHISSRNSEVIHAGIYYPQNSLKARLCVRGKNLLYEYCEKNRVAHNRCGKLIVAGLKESEALEALQEKARANSVDDLLPLSRAEIEEMEPDLASELALFSPSSGIVDSHEFMASLLRESEAAGMVFARQTRVTGMSVVKNQGEYLIETEITSSSPAQSYSFRSSAVINCAGLFAGEIAGMLATGEYLEDGEETGEQGEGQDQQQAGVQVHFCKGDYFTYSGSIRLRHLVYPLPEANTVGLGIHATLDLGGQLRFGPDTEYVDRLNYDIDAGQAVKFAEAIRQYLPKIKAEELQPSYSGIRPKLTTAGEPPADFVVATGNGEERDRVIHLLGIESPGLTSSLAIAELVTDRLAL